MEFDRATELTAWSDILGGKELVAYFGRDPIFHDGEIVQLVFNRRASSRVSIHIWGMENVDPVRHAVVTLTIEDIFDLDLENFSHQNVIYDLFIRPLPERPERKPYYARSVAKQPIEIEFAPSYGLHGFIRAGRVRVSFVPGLPRDSRKIGAR